MEETNTIKLLRIHHVTQLYSQIERQLGQQFLFVSVIDFVVIVKRLSEFPILLETHVVLAFNSSKSVESFSKSALLFVTLRHYTHERSNGCGIAHSSYDHQDNAEKLLVGISTWNIAIADCGDGSDDEVKPCEILLASVSF